MISLRDMEGFKLCTQDGDFGQVKAFLIDDFDWVVRYLIVDIDDHHTILSPRSVKKIQMDEGVVALKIDLEKILNSPSVDLDKDLSRELERQLSDYYHWPYYWEPTEYPETLPGDLTAVPLIEMELEREYEEAELIPETGESAESAAGSAADGPNYHIRSTHEIFGYTMHATNDDRSAGKLHDFIVNDKEWNILYAVVDRGGLFSDRKVLVSPSWVEAIDEDQRRVLVNLKEETIKDSPEFTSIQELTEEFQARHKEYFGEE